MTEKFTFGDWISSTNRSDRCRNCCQKSNEVGPIVYVHWTWEWLREFKKWLCVRCIVKVAEVEQEILKRERREKREYCNLCDISPFPVHTGTTALTVKPIVMKAEIYKEKYQFACDRCIPILEKWDAIYLGLPRRPRKAYPVVDKIRTGKMASIGTGKSYTVDFVTDGWFIKPMAVSAIHECYVTFEVPFKSQFDIEQKENCGYRYPRLSYEQIKKEVEFPRGSMAARAIARGDAMILYPEAKNNKKKDEENARKREEHVEAHWRGFMPGICQGMREFESRQRYAACDRKWRLYANDPFLDKIREKLIPRPNWFAEFLEDAG